MMLTTMPKPKPTPEEDEVPLRHQIGFKLTAENSERFRVYERANKKKPGGFNMSAVMNAALEAFWERLEKEKDKK